ncbi:nucleotide exchange factor GrpE [Acidiferrobacter sp.]|uniref:nucleotide exchange factor GrpE n=1 Tax=Acidiferrobacter sp. TaxID=1872107 RepID=UPI00262328FB|nr:nucleotide exchange factor GrpE [Acidiferrobacter sp.]
MPDHDTVAGDKETGVETQAPGREGPQAAAGDPAVLAAELEKARAELAESRERLLRVAADAENSRRRAEQDAATARKFALERFATELLPVRDSLDRARAVDRSTASAATEALFAGVDLTLQLLDAAFEKFAITVIDPAGARFNPDHHQALSMVESQDVPANHIVEVVQKGFLLNDRLLRPALVVVAKPKS